MIRVDIFNLLLLIMLFYDYKSAKGIKLYPIAIGMSFDRINEKRKKIYIRITE